MDLAVTVFISHKKADRNKALGINLLFKEKGIPTFLDEIDLDDQTPDTITDAILEKLDECTHIFAIISDVTKDSWWVPFEIGAATKGGKRICTYNSSSLNLPEYLLKWPVLTNIYDLPKFFELYKEELSIKRTEDMYNNAYPRPNRATKATPGAFHQKLKASINQRTAVY